MFVLEGYFHKLPNMMKKCTLRLGDSQEFGFKAVGLIGFGSGMTCRGCQGLSAVR